MSDTQTTPSGLAYLRTPDDRFDDLEGFPYTPKYVEVDGLRMGYVDEGPADAPVMLLLHGEPTWSYLYRRMIPPLLNAGFRCVAPDLIGFGRSDKPTDRAVYTYASHVRWLTNFLAAVDLPEATLFAQDWGGLIGLRVVAEEPDRFDRVAIGNTALPVGATLGQGFDFWLNMSQTMPVMDAGAMLQNATTARELTPGEMDGYRAPFPDESYMAGAREFPCLVPITPEHGGVVENVSAWSALENWTRPFLTLWCPGDRVLGHLGQEFIDRVPGASGQPHQQFEPGGHFIQDDHGEEVAAAIVSWMG